MHRRLKIYKAKSCIRFFLYKKFAFFNVFIGKKNRNRNGDKRIRRYGKLDSGKN